MAEETWHKLFLADFKNDIFGIQRGKIFGDLGPLLSEAIALISRALYLRPVTHLDPLTERFHQSVILHLYSLLNTSLTFSLTSCVTWTNWMAFQTKRFVSFLFFGILEKPIRSFQRFLNMTRQYFEIFNMSRNSIHIRIIMRRWKPWQNPKKYW